MGLHDRPYMQTEGPTGGGRLGGLAVGMPKPGRVVKWLLIINIAAFVLQLLVPVVSGQRVRLEGFFAVTVGGFWGVWRYITFQFLHSTGWFWHLPLNMLGLYMLGSPLERQWGGRRFLKFYLSCGVAAGVAFVVLAGIVGLAPNDTLIGASGGVFGIILACAVLFPHFKLIFFLFPVPIRLAAVIIFGGMILLIVSSLGSGQYSPDFWSHVAHLGGAVTAAVWIWVVPGLSTAAGKRAAKLRRGAWDRKMKKLADDQASIDRILHKIHDHGINALTAKEKKLLRQATMKQQQSDRDLYRL